MVGGGVWGGVATGRRRTVRVMALAVGGVVVCCLALLHSAIVLPFQEGKIVRAIELVEEKNGESGWANPPTSDTEETPLSMERNNTASTSQVLEDLGMPQHAHEIAASETHIATDQGKPILTQMEEISPKPTTNSTTMRVATNPSSKSTITETSPSPFPSSIPTTTVVSPPAVTEPATTLLNTIIFPRRSTNTSTNASRALEVYHLHLPHAHHGSTICRIPNIVRDAEGLYIVPAWLQRHQDILAKCGLDRDKVSFETYVDTDATLPLDLLLPSIPKDDPPRFAYDILLSVPTLEVVYRSTDREEMITYQCIDEAGNCGVVEPKLPLSQRFNPLLLLPRKLENLTATSWTGSFLRMIHGVDVDSDPPPTLAYHHHLFALPNAKVAFRSAFFAQKKVDGQAEKQLTQKSFLFAYNQIHRDGQETCPLVVTILEASNGLPTLSDAAKDTKSALSQSILEAVVNRTHKGVQVRIEDLTKLSFRGQVDVMQSTDVLIARHDVVMANILFLRAHTPVFEIAPFLYRSDVFLGIARQLRLIYKRVTAAPDLDNFERCVRRLHPPDSGGRTEAEKAIHDFRIRYVHPSFLTRRTITIHTNPVNTFHR